MDILSHDRRHDFINQYGISWYNCKDLHAHDVVIGFIFTYAVQDQLAANLYHEQKSNFTDRHQLHLIDNATITRSWSPVWQHIILYPELSFPLSSTTSLSTLEK
jgi:hypothetical protein